MKKLLNLLILAMSILALSTICNAQITNKYALVIGIRDYPNDPSKQKLKYADKDATLFADFLKSEEGGLFKQENITLLTNENATKDSVVYQINRLKEQVTYDNLVYIYFSGHGKVDEDDVAYLMLHDTDIDSLEDTGICTDEFLQLLNDSLHVQSLITFINACAFDSILSDSTSNGELTNDVQHYENIVNQYNDKWAELFQNQEEIRMTFFSSSPGENSYEHEALNGGQGLFTYFLIEGLRGGADGVVELNNVVTVKELLRYVVTRVSRYALAKLSKHQHPICTPHFPENYPLAIVKLIDFSNKKTIDFSRLVVRVKGNLHDYKDLSEKVERNISLALKGMNRGDVSSQEIHDAFTDIGYRQLENIVANTNPNPDKLYYPIRLLETSDPYFIQVRDITVFIEKGNTYNLVPLCFIINKANGKIDELFFASPPKELKKPQPDSLQVSDTISPRVQEKIMQFISKYMTAYYVNDIDFIEKIFSDEALIIVGNVIRTTASNLTLNDKIKYYIKTKPEYLESLKNVFENDTFIKLEFNDIIMEKHRLNNFVGVTIKQLWYAEHYWDEGFLFLLFEHDENEPDKFVLHVRAWQDDELDQGPLIGVHSVNFIPEVDTTNVSSEKN